MDKLFSVAGVSTLDGVVKARFAKDMSRAKVLEKNGHKAVRLIELPKAMAKDEALAHLRSHAAFQDAAAQSAFAGEGKVEAKPNKMAQAMAHAAVKSVAAKAAKAALASKAVDVKSKNLETMKKVSAKMAEREQEEKEAEYELSKEELGLGVDTYLKARA